LKKAVVEKVARQAPTSVSLTLTAALLDRLTHHSQVLLFEGESNRFGESAGRLSKPRRTTS
jgi:hypothetical protein